MAAYGLYTHIASNRFRSMLLLGGLFLLVYVMVFAGALIAEAVMNSQRPFDDYIVLATRDLIQAFPYATIGSALWIVIAYFFNQQIIDAVTGGHDVTRQEQPRLYNLLENLCISRGIPMPKLKIVDDPALNAFASGLNRSQYSVTVTSGLLNALNDREMEAVLGHELTHIRNGDVQLMVVAVIIAGVIGFVAELVFRLFFNSSWSFGGGGRSSSSSDGDKKGGGAFAIILLAIALIGLAWGLSLVVRFALSRSARTAGGRRLRRTDERPGRHDFGAAQDRGTRRTAGRDLGGDGNVHRQSARRLRRPVRHPSVESIPASRRW